MLKETAVQYGTSVNTIIRRFDCIIPQTMKGKKLLPSVIAIDEFKGNADNQKFQLIIANAVTKEPIDILPNRKKATIEAYLSKYGANVKVVVMDMSHSFKAAVNKALGNPVIIADRFHFVRYMYGQWSVLESEYKRIGMTMIGKRLRKNALCFSKNPKTYRKEIIGI